VQEGEWVAVAGEPRLHLSYGEDEPLRGKALYFLRATGGPIDAEKVGVLMRSYGLRVVQQSPHPPPPPPPTAHWAATSASRPQADASLMVGEIAADPLAQLELHLGHAFARHVEERPDWGAAGGDVKETLGAELALATAAVKETREAVARGLSLRPVTGTLDLDDLLRVSIARAKSKKPPVEAEAINNLHGAVAPLTGLGKGGGCCPPAPIRSHTAASQHAPPPPPRPASAQRCCEGGRRRWRPS
jgi:hypothetical protein